MSRPLIYIDQNIVGLALDGHINLSPQSAFTWTYSKQHFLEIRKSSNASKYLTMLESIGAKLLDLEIDESRENVKLCEQGSPQEHYQSYLHATKDITVEDNIFDPLQAWFNGGGDEESLRELPKNLAGHILDLTSNLPVEYSAFLIEKLDHLHFDFSNIIEHGNDISKIRKAIGDGKGAIGSIKGENQVQRIWEIIRPFCNEITCDQFFGFDPVKKSGYELWPIYLGIISCCAVMDIVGFHAEKKCRKIEKLPNVRSDAAHIAMGAFCSAILSMDKKLIKRAKAIYEYKCIGTQAFLIERV